MSIIISLEGLNKEKKKIFAKRFSEENDLYYFNNYSKSLFTGFLLKTIKKRKIKVSPNYISFLIHENIKKIIEVLGDEKIIIFNGYVHKLLFNNKTKYGKKLFAESIKPDIIIYFEDEDDIQSYNFMNSLPIDTIIANDDYRITVKNIKNRLNQRFNIVNRESSISFIN